MTPQAKKPRVSTHKENPAYFNRELSWLAFNERVLDQAFSSKYPLLERTRFLSFVSSNLDQFYEIRVAGLMQKVDAGITRPSMEGTSPQSLLVIGRSGMLTGSKTCCQHVAATLITEHSWEVTTQVRERRP